jgi:D-lactate dehydrogenase (cytochrome)
VSDPVTGPVTGPVSGAVGSPVSSAVGGVDRGALRAQLCACLGAAQVSDEPGELRRMSQDVYRDGALPLAVVRPGSTAEVAALVRLAARFRCPLFARGGGMSYTDAYLPDRPDGLIVDLRRLDRVREIQVEDLYVTVEAGCTWAALDAALEPHGLRAIFWGPMSGARATIGGGFSQGAATFGSGRHGTSAAAALAFEVVLGDGSVLQTGLAGAPHEQPFFRNYGPDLTGLFAGDAGALGIKTAVTLQLEPRPGLGAGLSFGFRDFPTLRRAISGVARRGLASEIFGVETDLARLAAGDAGIEAGIRALWAVGKAQGGAISAVSRMARMAVAGRNFLGDAPYTANFLVEADDRDALERRLEAIRRSVGSDGEAVAPTMADVVRATPFPPPMVLGPGGRRLLPLHVVLPHSRVDAFHEALEALRAREAAALEAHRVLLFVVFAGVGPSAILYEPVLYWEDEWNDLQRDTMPAALLAQMREPAPAPAARAYVESLRREIVALMLAHRGAHLQIGRAYPFLEGRTPPFLALLQALKRHTDPHGLVNPGALGLAP